MLNLESLSPMPNWYDWVCLDLETSNATPDDLERHMRLEWKPDRRWKAETIGTRFMSAQDAKLKKLALLDESPIISVGLRAQLGGGVMELRCLHCMELQDAHEVQGGLVEGFDTTAEMLITLRNLLDGYVTGETLIVGHNIKTFDLPKLRWAYVHHGLCLPDCLVDKGQPVYDTMYEYRRYSIHKPDVMVSAADLWEKLKLPTAHKQVIDGAKIPELYAAGEYAPIIKYQLLDVLNESEAYLRMTGRAEGLS